MQKPKTQSNPLSTTIRLPVSTRTLLQDMAKQSGQSMQDILELALKAYHEQMFWNDVQNEYASIRTNPELWKEEQDERVHWESTLMDGLKDE